MAKQRFVSHRSSSLLYSKMILSIGMFLLILLFFVQGISSLSDRTRSRQLESLENAIMRDITDCYAMEGAYPEDLEYLKEHYGLTYDERTFFVDYRVSGSNLRPEVTIIERKEPRP